MKTLLIVLSSVLTLASVMPYLRDVVKGTTKPRVVSWFTWSLLMGIASAASFSAHQYAGAILLVFASIATFSIVALGLHYGDRKFEWFDAACQAAAIAGLVLWLAFDSPMIAIIATVSIDLVGALPTLKHTWQKPHEETWPTFLLGAAGGLFTVAAANNWKITAVAYPIYIVLINLALTCIILMRRRSLLPGASLSGEPAELREL